MKTADSNSKIKYIIRPLLAVLVAFTSIGCMSSGDNGDTEPPVVVQKSPSNASPDVPVNTHIIVVFNKSVININTSTFYLE